MNAKRQALKALSENNYFFKRHGGNHDIYYNEELHCSIPISHDFHDDDLKLILDEIKKNNRRRG